MLMGLWVSCTLAALASGFTPGWVQVCSTFSLDQWLPRAYGPFLDTHSRTQTEGTAATWGMFLFSFFFFLAALRHMEFLSRGSSPSCGHNLQHRCGNTGSLNTLCQAGDRTCMLALQRYHRYHCATAGTALPLILIIRMFVASYFVPLFQDCFAYLMSLEIPYEF